MIAELAGRLDETELRYRHAREYAGDNEVPVLRLRISPRCGIGSTRSIRLSATIHAFLALSDPRRFSADRDAAVPVVARLASTLHVVDWRYAPFLVSPFAEWPDDPPVWPGRPSKGPF